jgi:hypothetical protein
MFNASVLVWIILFRFVLGAGMLLEIFVSTTMNTKLKDTHRLQPARRRSTRLSDHVQCFGAHLEKILRSVVGAGKLLEFFVSTTMNTKLKDTHRLRPACRQSPRLSDHVQCFGAGLRNFVPVCFR